MSTPVECPSAPLASGCLAVVSELRSLPLLPAPPATGAPSSGTLGPGTRGMKPRSSSSSCPRDPCVHAGPSHPPSHPPQGDSALRSWDRSAGLGTREGAPLVGPGHPHGPLRRHSCFRHSPASRTWGPRCLQALLLLEHGGGGGGMHAGGAAGSLQAPPLRRCSSSVFAAQLDASTYSKSQAFCLAVWWVLSPPDRARVGMFCRWHQAQRLWE